MPRRIYIVSAIDGNTVADAATNNCPEIVVGIPPALAVELNGVSLPHVYEEPAAAVDPCPCAHIPSVAGAPTEVPFVCEGVTPMVFDTTNSRLYAYIGGVWKFVQLN